MTPPKGKKFYGAVTISTRGQMVIPTEARRDFGIKEGDKVLVFGDLKTGLWVAPINIIEETMQGNLDLLKDVHDALSREGNGGDE